MPTYVCKRCGYQGSQKSNIRYHLTKLKPCKPCIEDIDREILLQELGSMEHGNTDKQYYNVNDEMKRLSLDVRELISSIKELQLSFKQHSCKHCGKSNNVGIVESENKTPNT